MAEESYYETFSSDEEDFLKSMAVRISDRFNGGDQRGRRMIDGARLDSDEMNLLTISTAGSKWRGEDDEDDSVMTRTTSEQMIPGARFNILGKMQMRKSSSSPVVQTPSPPPRSTRKSPTEHQQINLEQLANLSQSDVCVKNERNNKGLLESRKSPLLSYDNNNNGSSNSDESIDSPLDFSISAKKSKFRLEEPQTEAQSSRLRNILSMKSPVISENLQGTILNLSKESPNLAAAAWSCPIKKSRMSSESRSGSSSCSPVPMDHHSSDFLPSSPPRAEVKGGITMKAAGGIPTTSSPLSVSTTLGVGAMGYPPYGVFSTANLSPVMNQTVPSVPLPLPYETSPPLLAHQVNGSSTSPNLPFGSALSGSLPASNGAAAKGRVTRPFKAYPKDPMSFSAIGLYGLPMGTSPGSTEALIHQQSNVAYAEFRKQMLSQSQSSRSRRGGQRNGSDSFNSSAGDAINCNGNGSSNEDSHSANEDIGRSTSGKTEQQLKDEAYWERRRKNNEAAKRSRDARRAKEDEIAIRAAFLEQENLKLRFELCALKNETAKLRCMLYST